MKTIYKYPLQLCDEQTIAMPKNASILSAQWVRGEICIYAVVDTEEKMSEPHQFLIVGTGHPIHPNTPPKDHYFLGSVHNDDQSLIFHVFEKKSKEAAHTNAISKMKVEQCRRNPCFFSRLCLRWRIL